MRTEKELPARECSSGTVVFMRSKNTTTRQSTTREVLSAASVGLLLTLTACTGGGENVTKPTAPETKSVGVVEDPKNRCDSLDPIAALSATVKETARVEIAETFSHGNDISVAQAGGGAAVIKAGEKITVTTILERSQDGIVRYRADVTPEEFGVAYSDVVFTGDSVYVRFPDGTLTGADGLWVVAPLEDQAYVEGLLQSEPPTALDLRDALFGADGSVSAAIPSLPPVFGSVVLTGSSDESCSFDLEIAPEYGNRELAVVLDAKGEVSSVDLEDLDNQRATTIKVSTGPDNIAVPSEIARDSVGREYVQS
jgi:hypothetical protein